MMIMKSGPTKPSKTGSTAKTVMAPTKKPTMGTAVKKAAGAKTLKSTSSHNTAQGSKMVRPGMTTANATSAKKVKAYDTMAMTAQKQKAVDLAKARKGRVMTPSDGFAIRQDRLRNKPRSL
jgi:hypothetical protein